MPRAREAVGYSVGWILGGGAYVASRLRRARALHPRGETWLGEVTPKSPAFERLSGPVLLRLSAALSKKRPPGWFDVLGVALRFGWEPGRHDQRLSSDQDLLFATIRSPFTMPFAPLTTETRDAFANFYYAVCPFEMSGVGRVKFRLRPVGRVGFELECRRTGPPWRWHPAATIELIRRVPLDQEALRFWPFQSGRGIHPIGLVQWLRKGAYTMGQKGRPPSSRRAA